MINGMHAMFYTADPEGTRLFLRDVLGLRWADVGEGWLIFEAPPAEIGCHPPSPPHGEPGTHAISFTCEDIHATVKTLSASGVEFTGAISDQGYGLVTAFRMPGGVVAELYQPRYRTDYADSPASPG